MTANLLHRRGSSAAAAGLILCCAICTQTAQAQSLGDMLAVSSYMTSHPQPIPAGASELPSPFTQSAEEKQSLAATLTRWEAHNGRDEHSAYEFYLWEDLEFGGERPRAGAMKFQHPDRYEYKVDRVADPKRRGTNWMAQALEDWRCDGRSIYESRGEQRVVLEHRVPESFRGGLPFEMSLLFAPRAAILARFHMRLTTTQEQADKGEIWIEAVPRHSSELKFVQRVRFILSANDFSPRGLCIEPAGGNDGRSLRRSYLLSPQRPGGFSSLFVEEVGTLRLPVGWTFRRDELAEATQQSLRTK